MTGRTLASLSLLLLAWLFGCLIALGSRPAFAETAESDTTSASSQPPYDEPDALIVNLPERDLNTLLGAALRAKGGPRFVGSQADAGRGLRGVHYQVDLSSLLLKLEDGGRMSLSLEIEQADLQVERWERKLAGRTAYCENAGLTIDAAHPVSITADVNLSIADGDLEIVPRQISVSDAENIHLVRPSHCAKAPLPTWLLWKLGKTRLKHEIAKLDKTLLARVSRSAERFGGEEGLFKRRVSIPSVFDHGIRREFDLSPRLLSTDRGSLLVSLAGSTRTAERGPADSHGDLRADRPLSLDRTKLPQDRPSIAVSPVFINAMLASAFSGSTGVTRKAHGDFSRLLKSSSVYALIPGIRGIKCRETLSFSFAFHDPPSVEFVPRGSGAEIRLQFRGIEMIVWDKRPDGPVPLGAIVVDEGTVGLAPVPGTLGGVSLKVLENDWDVSSRGIEFDEPLFEATLQELMFAQAFETISEPILREGLTMGGITVAPHAFRVVDGYLVVELDASPMNVVPSLIPETAAAGAFTGARVRADASSPQANK